jgi:hypothetical protein
MFIWYIFSSFGIMHQEKSGNPGFDTDTQYADIETTPITLDGADAMFFK